MSAPVITIYTDGSALGNPGPGGYGVVLISGPHRKELSQGYRLTTNNRMELMAVCVALEALKFEGSNVTLYSDSKYVIEAVNQRWVFGWERKGCDARMGVWMGEEAIFGEEKPRPLDSFLAHLSSPSRSLCLG